MPRPFGAAYQRRAGPKFPIDMKTKKNNTPKIKRTRRHVVIRLTPEEARAAFLLCAQSTAKVKRGTRVASILMEACKAGEGEPARAPQPASIRRSRGATIEGYHPDA